MRLVDIVELWARERGLWLYKNSDYEGAYINISKDPEARGPGWGILTVWNSGRFDSWQTAGRLQPADPEFFTKLEKELDRCSSS